MLNTVGVIPARFGSTRFPGKPLALINGISLIERVYTAASQSQSLNKLIVATDHQEIFDHVKSFGGEVIMTASNISTGSDRVWQAIKGVDADIVVNIQGDEPLLKLNWLEKLIECFRDKDVQMSTLAKKLSGNEIDNTNVVKVILDKHSHAIYFSRFPIPYSKISTQNMAENNFKHIGLYAFRKNFLESYCQHPQVEIERAESLEQLRALYMGAKIKVVEVFEEAIGVDTPEDVKKIESLLELSGNK